MNMQTKIVAAIHKALEAAKVQGVEKWSYSNTGTIYVQMPDALETFFRIRLSFNDSYMGAEILLNSEKDLQGNRAALNSRYFPYLEYTDSTRLALLLAGISAQCPKPAKKGRR